MTKRNRYQPWTRKGSLCCFSGWLVPVVGLLFAAGLVTGGGVEASVGGSENRLFVLGSSSTVTPPRPVIIELDPESGEELNRFSVPRALEEPPRSSIVLLDGRLYVLGFDPVPGGFGGVFVFDPDSGELLGELPRNSLGSTLGSWSGFGGALVGFDIDARSIHYFDPQTLEVIGQLDLQYPKGPLFVSPTGGVVLEGAGVFSVQAVLVGALTTPFIINFDLHSGALIDSHFGFRWRGLSGLGDRVVVFDDLGATGEIRSYDRTGNLIAQFQTDYGIYGVGGGTRNRAQPAVDVPSLSPALLAVFAAALFIVAVSLLHRRRQGNGDEWPSSFS